MTVSKRNGTANSGSPLTGEPEYLLVGVLRRPHGLRGDLLMEVVTDFPDRLRAGARVYLGRRHEPHVVASARPHASGMLIRFDGIDSSEAAGLWRSQPVSVLTADRPALPAGLYYHHQLLGCSVVEETGRKIGTLTEILETGANDVFVITDAGGHEVLLPDIHGVILGVDLAERVITVCVPAGIGAGPEE